MSTADSLPIEDVFPAQAPESTPAQEPVAPPVEKAPETVQTPAAQDKPPQQPPQMIPKWRLDEVLEQNRAFKAQLQQHAPAQPQANEPPAPKQEDFPTWEAFQRAETEHISRQAARQEWANLSRQQQQDLQHRSFSERLQTADTRFDDELGKALAVNPKLAEKLQNAPSLRPDLQLVLKESDLPAALAEHLADNPLLVLELNRLAPDKAMYKMGQMEAKLTTVSGGPSKMPSAKAPNIDPVGGASTPQKKDPYKPETSPEDYVLLTRKLPKR